MFRTTRTTPRTTSRITRTTPRTTSTTRRVVLVTLTVVLVVLEVILVLLGVVLVALVKLGPHELGVNQGSVDLNKVLLFYCFVSLFPFLGSSLFQRRHCRVHLSECHLRPSDLQDHQNHPQEHQNHLQDHQNHPNKQPPLGGSLYVCPVTCSYCPIVISPAEVQC